MGRTTINGKVYEGKSISIVGDKVMIDGKLIESDTDKKILIYVEGHLDNLDCTTCQQIVVYGSTGDINTASGDVYAAEIKGDVQTVSGDVTVNGDIGGNINTTSGDVEANDIQGRVETLSGDVDKSFRKNRITGQRIPMK